MKKILFFFGILFLASPALGSPPNIVLIIGDDQAWTDYGFMGHDVIQTPQLDRLAAEGLTYTRGYVPTSLCRPSLASIITGLYPHQHGIIGNDPYAEELNRQDPAYLRLNEMLIERIGQHATLPRLLAEMGYVSFQSGKWWEGHFSRGGFTEGMTHGDPSRGGRHGDEGLRIGREGLEPIVSFVEKNRDRPFFIWYAPFLPHTPHNPPKRILNGHLTKDTPFEIARYYAMCQWFDESVGELVEFLEGSGLRENTLILYVADNGWIQRTPEQPVPSGWRFSFAPRSKRSPYEGGVRTPIILNWPGQISRGISDQPVSSIDILPTLLRVAGVKPPAALPGVDLLDPASVEQRQVVFGEVFTHDVRDFEDPVKSLKYRWCVNDNLKLIVPHWPNLLDSRIELYDVAKDPGETVNLVDDQQETVHRLYNAIQRWWSVD